MKLNTIQSKNKTKDLLLSVTKNCETLIDQTNRKAEETLESKMVKSREIFHFNPPIPIQGSCMIGLTDLEVYNSVLNIIEKNNKFELYKFLDEKPGGVPYEKVRDKIERDLDISDITATDLQDEIIAPIIIKEYRGHVTKRMKDDQYMLILLCYTSSKFHDFEIYLRAEVDLVEDDIRLVLDESNSSFITFELEPVIYTFEDLSKALFNILQPGYPASSSKTAMELNDITMRTKLFVRSGNIAIRFDEKAFFNTILAFNHGWEYKHYKEYISQKVVNLSSTNKIHFKYDFTDGSIVGGLKEPII